MEVHIGLILCGALGYHGRLRLDGLSAGHRGTIEIQIGLILCEALRHNGGSDKVDFIRTLGALLRFKCRILRIHWGLD